MTDQDEPVTAKQVDAIGRKLDDVKEAMQLKYFTARRAMRRSWLALGLAVVAVAAGLIVQWHETNQRDADRTAGAVVACKNANESRAAIEGRFEQLIAQLGNFNPPTDEAARALRQQFVDRFTADFRATLPAALAPRDCSPQAATQPTLVEKR